MTSSSSSSSSLFSLILCVLSIYFFFLVWGLLQERLTTTRYESPISLLHPTQTTKESRLEYFKSPLFLNTIQAGFSSSVAAVYLLLRSKTELSSSSSSQESKTSLDHESETIFQTLGLSALTASGASKLQKSNLQSIQSNISPLLSQYILISIFQSLSSQLGLLSLSHGISYPTLILGKSCKLIPVLLMNLLLYRRKFPPYKYLVVSLVTLGISLFMLFSPTKSSKSSSPSSSIGLLLLTANLFLDGATNSTQDQVFHQYKIKGSQMMLVMNLFSFGLLSIALLVPAPYIPMINTKPKDGNELSNAMGFIARHPEVLRDGVAYALAGALGQVAIFETLERFGSLTLVSITVSLENRKGVAES